VRKKLLYLTLKLRNNSKKVDAIAKDFNYSATDALVGFSPTI
jgi:hypothetical protein